MRSATLSPSSSLLRLYDPGTHGNSFSLDGFPAIKEDKDWKTRLIEFIQLKGALGMTTNQTLFRQLLETGVLDGRLREFRAAGRAVPEIYQTLYNEAATEAARIFAPVHAERPWEGRVSQEASALLTELGPLVREVRRIAGAMKGVPAFTKVPNLKVGPQAVRLATATGEVSPNVTLIFSDRHYLDTAEGYVLGLKDLADKGGHLPAIHSVNSLFVSRTDRVVDPMIALRQAQGDRLDLLKGKVAVAQAKKIYQMFEAIFLGKPFQDPEGLYADEEGKAIVEKIDRLRALFGTLKNRGANPQRLLIASSGVKSDQPYSPLLYVLPFLGPWSANTMPEGTFEALTCFVAGLSETQAASLRRRNLMAEPFPEILTEDKEWDKALLMTAEERRQEGIGAVTCDQILRRARDHVLGPAGTSLRKIGDDLRDKGAGSFTADEQATLTAIQTKLQAL
ncbi:MAG: transaldolase family protein [Candidatus Omnitrophota bacterium]|nr:transaldolase family protein [Candidatus Omnitrophota bacterium]